MVQRLKRGVEVNYMFVSNIRRDCSILNGTDHSNYLILISLQSDGVNLRISNLGIGLQRHRNYQ